MQYEIEEFPILIRLIIGRLEQFGSVRFTSNEDQTFFISLCTELAQYVSFLHPHWDIKLERLNEGFEISRVSNLSRMN